MHIIIVMMQWKVSTHEVLHAIGDRKLWRSIIDQDDHFAVRDDGRQNRKHILIYFTKKAADSIIINTYISCIINKSTALIKKYTYSWKITEFCNRILFKQVIAWLTGTYTTDIFLEYMNSIWLKLSI